MIIARIALLVAFIALALRVWYAPGRHGSSVRARRVRNRYHSHRPDRFKDVYRITRGWGRVFPT